jgi:hypothetical protein
VRVIFSLLDGHGRGNTFPPVRCTAAGNNLLENE